MTSRGHEGAFPGTVTREADTRGRDHPASSGQSRIQPCHNILHLGVDRRRRQNSFLTPGLFVSLAHSPRLFVSLRGPLFDGRLSEHSILWLLFVLFWFLMLRTTHTALHCPTVLWVSRYRKGTGKGGDSIVFFKATVGNSYTTCIHITLIILRRKYDSVFSSKQLTAR